jgi:hypothetical protein
MKKNFFEKLFSPKFDDFITPSLASGMYILLMVTTALGVAVGLFTVIRSFFTGLDLTGLVTLPAGLIFLVVIRSLLETSVALIKIAENTQKSVD